MARRLRIKIHRKPVMSIARSAFDEKKLVYVALANKRFKYPWGRSRIVYIGTTEVGVGRIASSAVRRGSVLLFDHGVKDLDFHTVTCGRMQNVESWKKLENALLIKFRERFGAVPRANTQGKFMHWDDEKKYFADKKLQEVIDALSSLSVGN